MRYETVDTNFLRIALLPRLAAAGSEDRFVLTDTTILETMKTPFWQTDAQRSFSAIGSHLEKIVVAKAPGELMRSEIRDRHGITSIRDVIDIDLTTAFRGVLLEIASGTAGPQMSFIKSQIGAAQTELASHQLNGVLNEQGLRSATDDIKRAFKLRDYRRITDGNQAKLLRVYGIRQLAQKATEMSLTNEGVPVGKAQMMSANDCFCLRQAIALYSVGWRWAMRGSLPERLEKITNELMDLDQALIGSYCDGILSREDSVRELRDDILNVLRAEIQLEPGNRR